MPPSIGVPSPIVAFNSHFPLKTNPPIVPIDKTRLAAPTLWIVPPRPSSEPLSSNVECLKWQAYLVLRGLKGIKVRWDIASEGILGGFPNLHVPWSEGLINSDNSKTSQVVEDGQLLAAYSILAWADMKLGVDSTADPLEGYKDQEARLESRAWVSLLEDVVHAALLIAQPHPPFWRSILFPQSTPTLGESLQKILSPPPGPITGLLSVFPSYGVRINTSSVMSRYKEAIASLSERLGTDKWFLGSSGPTPLDALTFAYLHCILHSSDKIRIEVSRRANLVAWELKVRRLVKEGFAN